jgi:hypothetical protein
MKANVARKIAKKVFGKHAYSKFQFKFPLSFQVYFHNGHYCVCEIFHKVMTSIHSRIFN